MKSHEMQALIEKAHDFQNTLKFIDDLLAQKEGVEVTVTAQHDEVWPNGTYRGSRCRVAELIDAPLGRDILTKLRAEIAAEALKVNAQLAEANVQVSEIAERREEDENEDFDE